MHSDLVSAYVLKPECDKENLQTKNLEQARTAASQNICD